MNYNTVKLSAVKLHKRIVGLQNAASDLDIWINWTPVRFTTNAGCNLAPDGYGSCYTGLAIKGVPAYSPSAVELLKEMEPELNAAMRQVLDRYAVRLHSYLAVELAREIREDARISEPRPHRKLALHNDEELALCET